MRFTDVVLGNTHLFCGRSAAVRNECFNFESLGNGDIRAALRNDARV